MEKRCLESQKRKLKHMIPIDDILKADIEYTDEVIRLYKKATKYLKSYTWCEKILNCWLAKGFGYILCIFDTSLSPGKCAALGCPRARRPSRHGARPRRHKATARGVPREGARPPPPPRRRVQRLGGGRGGLRGRARQPSP